MSYKKIRRLSCSHHYIGTKKVVKESKGSGSVMSDDMPWIEILSAQTIIK